MSPKPPGFAHRIGRFLAWPNPRLYRPVGLIRGRGDIYATNYDIWVDGFPRSANTFAVKSIKAANPSTVIRSHRHIPVFIIQSVRDGKPGMLMLRKPEDAVVSWALFWRSCIAECLDYYVDFHRPLLRHLPELFVAHFDQAITGFDSLVESFNAKFGTNLHPPRHNSQTLTECFAEMDQDMISWRGFLDEMRVPRPSTERAALRRQVRQELRQSPALSRRLQAAHDLYLAFAPPDSKPAPKPLAAGTQQLPTCV